MNNAIIVEDKVKVNPPRSVVTVVVGELQKWAVGWFRHGIE